MNIFTLLGHITAFEEAIKEYRERGEDKSLTAPLAYMDDALNYLGTSLDKLLPANPQEAGDDPTN